jgi:hypothetical protein
MDFDTIWPKRFAGRGGNLEASIQTNTAGKPMKVA